MHSELPELTGTEKQIAWAEDIRRDAITEGERSYRTWMDDLNATLARTDIDDARRVKTQQRIDAAQRGWDMLHTKTSAAWWIDNRSKLGTLVHDAGALRRNRFLQRNA